MPFVGEGAAEASVALEAGQVSFWTDVELEFDGEGGLTYSIELFQNGSAVANTVCNPLGNINVKTGWVSTDLGAAHSRRGNGKMSCNVLLSQAGATTIKASLVWNPKPTRVALKRADLVVKQ